VYEYDEHGRLLASTPEPEWDDTEREWMLELARWRSEVLCPCGCGWPVQIAHDEMAAREIEVPPPTRCYVATKQADARKAYLKAAGAGATLDGLLFGARIRPPTSR